MSILTPKIEVELIQKALRIQNLDKSATKAVIDHDIENLFIVLKEFLTIKKEIKEVILDIPTSTINNQQALAILRKVSSEYEFQCDKYLKTISQAEGFEWFRCFCYMMLIIGGVLIFSHYLDCPDIQKQKFCNYVADGDTSETCNSALKIWWMISQVFCLLYYFTLLFF